MPCSPTPSPRLVVRNPCFDREFRLAASQFGSHVKEDIDAFIFEPQAISLGFGASDEDDEDDDDDLGEDEEDEEDDDGEGEAQAAQTGWEGAWGSSTADDGDSLDASGPGAPGYVLSPGPFQDADDSVAEFLDNSHNSWGPDHSATGSHGFPRLQRARNGLTALSQKFNLYFSAYQDKIYVYRPQRGPQILPSHSLILRPKPSEIAKKVGGYLNKSFPHQVNHLIVGDLGNFEVLLFCYDDGDVVAYYTHQIARCVRESSKKVSVPDEFFHGNVGMSAWGLAIHKKSRLLAVTCNKHEVTVFAFAVTDCDKDNPLLRADPATSGYLGMSTYDLETHVKCRTRTWQLIYPVSAEGANMPNVAFCDDAAGNAEKVITVDLNGNTWIMDIWKLCSEAVLIPQTVRHQLHRSNSVGWGVLVLSDDDFKPTNTYAESLGLPKQEIMTNKVKHEHRPSKEEIWWDTTCSLFYVRGTAPDMSRHMRNFPIDYNAIHRHRVISRSSIEDDATLYISRKPNEEDSEAARARFAREAEAEEEQDSLGKRLIIFDHGPSSTGRWLLFNGTETREHVSFARVLVTSIPQLPYDTSTPASLKNFLDWDANRRRHSEISYEQSRPPRHHAKMSIFRTTATSVELQPLDFTSGPAIHCENVLTYYNHNQRANAGMPWDMYPVTSQRISMLLHVRELNLVVCGSLCGRVALVTLTRPRRYHADMPFRRGFRVDAVLPRLADEEKKLRPHAPLHGLAVSPVPDHKARGVDLHRPEREGKPSFTQVYRLILHYLDHTILMYHLSRSSRDDDLLII